MREPATCHDAWAALVSRTEQLHLELSALRDAGSAVAGLEFMERSLHLIAANLDALTTHVHDLHLAVHRMRSTN